MRPTPGRWRGPPAPLVAPLRRGRAHPPLPFRFMPPPEVRHSGPLARPSDPPCHSASLRSAGGAHRSLPPLSPAAHAATGDAGAHRALPPPYVLPPPPRCGSRPPSPRRFLPPPPCGAAPTPGGLLPLHGSRPLRSPRTVVLHYARPAFRRVVSPASGVLERKTCAPMAHKTSARSADRRPNAAGRAALLFGPLPAATWESTPPPIRLPRRRSGFRRGARRRISIRPGLLHAPDL